MMNANRKHCLKPPDRDHYLYSVLSICYSAFKINLPEILVVLILQFIRNTIIPVQK